MNRLLVLFSMTLAAGTLSGCAYSAASPVTGFAYTAAKSTHGATSNPIGSKTGKSCAMSILGIVGMGDASAAAAAQSAGITQISTVDAENFGVLGIYATNCTIVTGE